MANAWNPEQYDRFKKERMQPFFDLMALVQREPGMRVIDLGCGTGDPTQTLHTYLGTATVLGIDSSEAMLAKAAPYATKTLKFQTGDIATFDVVGEYDLVFSNAALQWIADHPKLLERLTRALKPGGQLAFQVPANFDHPAHRLAQELAHQSPFSEALSGYAHPENVLTPETYATLLYELGFKEQIVRQQVYGHPLEATTDVIEWVKGTLLTAYQERLARPVFEKFLEVYRARLIDQLGEGKYFYTYKRDLVWGRKG
jgi:trans-aconitate 2-methyltransferase